MADYDNVAFVFIKPHAVTEPTKELAKRCLKANKINILKEGTITSEEIGAGRPLLLARYLPTYLLLMLPPVSCALPAADSKKLIDQHYYAIASKVVFVHV